MTSRDGRHFASFGLVACIGLALLSVPAQAQSYLSDDNGSGSVTVDYSVLGGGMGGVTRSNLPGTPPSGGCSCPGAPMGVIATAPQPTFNNPFGVNVVQQAPAVPPGFMTFNQAVGSPASSSASTGQRIVLTPPSSSAAASTPQMAEMQTAPTPTAPAPVESTNLPVTTPTANAPAANPPAATAPAETNEAANPAPAATETQTAALPKTTQTQSAPAATSGEAATAGAATAGAATTGAATTGAETPPAQPDTMPTAVPSPVTPTDNQAAAAPAQTPASEAPAQAPAAEAPAPEAPAATSNDQATAPAPATEEPAAPSNDQATAPATEQQAAVTPTPPAESSTPPAGGAALPAGAYRILYTGDSDDVPATSNGDLDTVVKDMLADTNKRVQVLAYAAGTEDSEGKARRKSLARGLAVRSYLIKAGVPSTRIDVRALGTKAEGGPADRVDIIPAS